MPNQRKEGKDLISQWIAKGNKKALYAEAKRRGISVATMLDGILKKEIKKLNRKAVAKNGRRKRTE